MAPIFVGSTDDDSKIRDNRVGFAISTANPGTASEGDIYFNSTDKQLRGYDGSAWAAIGGGGGGSAEFTVSGTLSDGQTVILKSDGNVAGVTTTQITQTTGFTTTTYHSGNTSDFDITWDASNQKVVIAYRDQVDGDKGKAIVGTISGTSISFGSAVTFDSGRAEYISIVYDSTNERVVIGYIDNSNQNQARAIVGNVSGTSISFGSVTDFTNNNANDDCVCKYISGVHNSTDNKIVFAFQETTESDRGRAIVATVDPSDNSISFGDRVTFETGITFPIQAVYDSNLNKTVIVYGDSSDSQKGKATVGTISGTDISFGSEWTFETGNTYHIGAAFDSENNKVVIAYKDAGDSSYGKVKIGTVSGTMVTYGTEVIFSTQNTNDSNVIYDPIAKKVVILFRDNSDQNTGKYQVGTVVGTGITFEYQQNNDNLPAFNAATGGGTLPHGVFASTENVIPFIFRNQSNNYYQEASVFRNERVATNLEANNFLGFSNGAYTNGQSATIQMVGAVDDAQTGLTTATRLFVQTGGSLDTTADTPSVFAGTAISATKIIVRK